MSNIIKPDYGIGIEMEGFIVDGNRPTVRIEGIAASEWTMKRVKDKYPQLADHVSAELLSVMLEVKTDVHTNAEKAVEQILEIRAAINKILEPHGSRLMFIPILPNDEYEIMAADSNPESRPQQLIKKWGDTPLGIELIRATAIASLQVNDSRPFEDLKGQSEEDHLERALEIHNLYSANFERLNKRNGRITASNGQTRLDKLKFLMANAKKTRFAERGYTDPEKIILPGHFKTVEEMQHWMITHTEDAKSWEDANSKNEHGGHVKVKRPEKKKKDTIVTTPENTIVTMPWVTEARGYDAVNMAKDMLAIMREDADLHAQLNHAKPSVTLAAAALVL